MFSVFLSDALKNPISLGLGITMNLRVHWNYDRLSEFAYNESNSSKVSEMHAFI
jgi:hypothetical protein